MSDDDVLRRLRDWLVRCRRHAHPPSVTEIGDTLSLAVAEIERLRRANEKLQTEREQLQRIATGRSLRGGGGMAR